MSILIFLPLIATAWFIFSSQHTSSLILRHVEKNHKEFAIHDTHYYYGGISGDKVSFGIVLYLIKNGRLASLNDEYINKKINILKNELKYLVVSGGALISFIGYIVYSHE